MSSTPSVSFDLHKLGWKAFEDLVACIFRDVMGQTFQSFPEGTDGGRDGAFHGEWSPQSGETMSGSFTVQCKHTSNSGKLLPKAVVNGELPKVTRLATQELTDVYILVTNHRVTAKRTAQTEKAFMESGAKFAKVYDSKWINTTIEERPTLRRLVPRLYGLGDLTQVVTNQAYRQAREVLDSLIPDLDCFVPTEAYRKKHSSNFMDEHLVGGLLTSQEINNQLVTLKNHIFSNNDEIIADISSSWDGDEDPDYLFSDLKETLKVIDKQGDKEEKEVASMFLNKISDAVSEMEDSQPDKKEYETLEAEETSVESEPFVRSIFDDVDE